MTNTFIHPTAVIYPNVDIGKNVYIGAYCVVGSPAESKNDWGNEGKGVSILDGTILNGHVTIDSGTVRRTMVAKNCFIMKHCHIGHDAFLCQGVIMSPGSKVGGHSEIGLHTNMGMGSVVHQRVTVPSYCMLGMNTVITRKTNLIASGVYVGVPAKWIRENKRG